MAFITECYISDIIWIKSGAVRCAISLASFVNDRAIV